MTAAIAVLGCASNVGKSWLATGLCRALARRGLRVAPFKALNMSNNAAPARTDDGTWGEIGRAQALQAQAAGVEPHVDHNPLLLKPSGAAGSQVVLLGRALGHTGVTDFRGQHGRWREAVCAAYDRVAAGVDVVVLEGAGSPAEINLQDRDLANGVAARHAAARAREAGAPFGTLLVGDIDRGGVFASLYGTLALMRPEDRALVTGVVINRLRGDPAWLAPGPERFEALAGVRVRGVLPYVGGLVLDEEDGEAIGGTRAAVIDVCALRLPTVSNFTDLGGLSALEGVGLRYTDTPEALGNPDLLVLPGCRDTLGDLAWLRRVGLDRAVVAAAARGVPVLGLCGGYQLLGERLRDPEGVAGSPGVVPGLGLLPVQTTFSADKRVRPARGVTLGGWLLPAGLAVSGYEIHQGVSASEAPALVALDAPDGAVSGGVAGSYLHGLLDAAPVARALVDALRARKALPPLGEGPGRDEARERDLERLADLVDAHIDLEGLLPA